MSFETAFKLSAPCGNCPFRKEGALELRSGRLEGIIADLLADDTVNFHCHKSVHKRATAGKWRPDGSYKPSGEEAFCAGALIYLEKVRSPSVLMRLGRVFGKYHPSNLHAAFDLVIDPLPDTCGVENRLAKKKLSRRG